MKMGETHMKRTWRSLVSLTMAAAMLLSMVIVSGVTASAEDSNAKIYRINSSNLYQDGIYSPVEIVDHTADKGFTITRGTEGVDNSVGAYFVIDPTLLADLPYLIIETDEATSNGLTVAFYGWGADGSPAARSDSFAASTAKQVIDLSAYVGYTCQLWVYGTAGQSISFKDVYFTNVNPNAPAGGPAVIAMADVSPYAGLATATVAKEGTVGMTMAGSGTYSYYELAQTTVQATPYLMYKFAAAPVATPVAFGTAIATWWGDYAGMPYTDTDAHVIDLRTVPGYAGGSVLLQLGFNEDLVTFDYFLLTDDATLDPASLATPKPCIVKNLNSLPAGFKGGYFETTADGLGFTGDLSTTTPEGYGYLYIALHDHIAATPYLVYQLNACDGGWAGGLTIGWVTPPTVANLVMDGARHVLDLRTIDDVNLVINFTFSTTLDMPIAYLTDDPNGDPLAPATPAADPVYYDVNFVTNGGSMVYSQLVKEGDKVDAVTCDKESYTATWYTDPECTTPYDFNAAVTSDLTLYAGWKITQGTSRVYAQISAGTTSTSTSADMRFVAAIDNVGFDEAGFVLVSYPEDYADLDAILVVDGTECNTMKTNTVWTSINAAGSVVTAADLGGKYIFALTVTNIPSKKGGFDINIGVKAYAKLGALVYYSNAKTYCVNDFLA